MKQFVWIAMHRKISFFIFFGQNKRNRMSHEKAFFIPLLFRSIFFGGKVHNSSDFAFWKYLYERFISFCHFARCFLRNVCTVEVANSLATLAFWSPWQVITFSIDRAIFLVLYLCRLSRLAGICWNNVEWVCCEKLEGACGWKKKHLRCQQKKVFIFF